MPFLPIMLIAPTFSRLPRIVAEVVDYAEVAVFAEVTEIVATAKGA